MTSTTLPRLSCCCWWRRRLQWRRDDDDTIFIFDLTVCQKTSNTRAPIPLSCNRNANNWWWMNSVVTLNRRGKKKQHWYTNSFSLSRNVVVFKSLGLLSHKTRCTKNIYRAMFTLFCEMTNDWGNQNPLPLFSKQGVERWERLNVLKFSLRKRIIQFKGTASIVHSSHHRVT